MRIDQVGSMNTSNIGSDRQAVKTDVEPVKVVKKSAKEPVKEQIDIKNQDVSDEVVDKDKEVIYAIEKANKHIRTYDRKLEFSIHQSTKKIMVKVVNTDDGSVIREIPSEKVLDMVAHLWEMAGVLVDEHR